MPSIPDDLLFFIELRAKKTHLFQVVTIQFDSITTPIDRNLAWNDSTMSVPDIHHMSCKIIKRKYFENSIGTCL